MPYDQTEVRTPDAPRDGATLTVTSETFADGGTIPRENTFQMCGGKNRSPQLAWSGAPPETQSFAITCFDPDAPTGAGYWHWVAWGLPSDATSLDADDAPPHEGRSDYGKKGYGGPCPPPNDGAHRYIFTVYALDVEKLDGVGGDTTGSTLVFTMRGHVLATGTITGHFGMP